MLVKLKMSPFIATAAAKTLTEAKMEADIIPLIAPYLTLRILTGCLHSRVYCALLLSTQNINYCFYDCSTSDGIGTGLIA